MSQAFDVEPADPRQLTLGRILAAPRLNVWRAWTEPELLKRWFAPKPYETVTAELDVRPGGATRIVMRGPDGTEIPGQGVYLSVEPSRRLVFTDAFARAWAPSAKPFMTVEVTLEDAEPGHTRYVVRVSHWSEADRQTHEAMGFHTGWAVCADQLEAVAAAL